MCYLIILKWRYRIITEQQYNDFIKQYKIIVNRASVIATAMENHNIDESQCSEISDSYISFTYSDGHCSNCMEDCCVSVPTRYLWIDDWQTDWNEQKRIQAEKEAEYQLKVKERQKQEQQNARKAQYIKLKKEFEQND